MKKLYLIIFILVGFYSFNNLTQEPGPGSFDVCEDKNEGDKCDYSWRDDIRGWITHYREGTCKRSPWGLRCLN